MDPLEVFIDESLRLSLAKGYTAPIFRRMRKHYGTVGAIKKLVVISEIQSGFKEFNKLGLLERSIEAAVLKFPEQFTPAERECAEFRLRQAARANT